MAKDTVDLQVRLVLERQCRRLAELIADALPAGVGFTLLIYDFGVKGNVAYCSSAQRADAIKLMREWIERAEAEAKPKAEAEGCICATANGALCPACHVGQR